MKKSKSIGYLVSAAASLVLGGSAIAQNNKMPPYTHGEYYKPKVRPEIKRMLPPGENSFLGKLGYSTKDFALGKPVPSGQLPKGMEVSLDGKDLYISDMGGTKMQDGSVRGSVTIIDIATRAIEKVWTPNGTGDMQGNTEMLFSSDGKYALSTQFQGNMKDLKCADDPRKEKGNSSAIITVIDTTTHKVLAYIPTGGQGSKIMAERPKRNQNESTIIYVANWFGDNLGVIDLDAAVRTPKACPEQKAPLATGALLRTIQFGEKLTKYPAKAPWKVAPRGTGFTLDGKYAIILGYETGTLQVVNAQTHAQLAELPPCGVERKKVSFESEETFQKEMEIARRMRQTVCPFDNFNLRHIILNKKGTVAYLSHMRGNAVSRIDIAKLVREVEEGRAASGNGNGKLYLSQDTWSRIFIPFATKSGAVNMLPLESYSGDHPEFANLKFPRSHPNTIFLDPVNNRYLYVSHRTTGITDSAKCKESKTPEDRLENGCDIARDLMGKVDVIDTHNGEVVISLVGGISPTALTVTHDNKTLMSSGYRDDKIYFYNVGKALELYEHALEQQGR